jgi:hypothetical protein
VRAFTARTVLAIQVTSKCTVTYNSTEEVAGHSHVVARPIHVGPPRSSSYRRDIVSV